MRYESLSDLFLRPHAKNVQGSWNLKLLSECFTGVFSSRAHWRTLLPGPVFSQHRPWLVPQSSEVMPGELQPGSEQVDPVALFSPSCLRFQKQRVVANILQFNLYISMDRSQSFFFQFRFQTLHRILMISSSVYYHINNSLIFLMP